MCIEGLQVVYKEFGINPAWRLFKRFSWVHCVWLLQLTALYMTYSRRPQHSTTARHLAKLGQNSETAIIVFCHNLCWIFPHLAPFSEPFPLRPTHALVWNAPNFCAQCKSGRSGWHADQQCLSRGTLRNMEIQLTETSWSSAVRLATSFMGSRKSSCTVLLAPLEGMQVWWVLCSLWANMCCHCAEHPIWGYLGAAQTKEFVISSIQVMAGYLQACSTTEDMMVLGVDLWHILPWDAEGADSFQGLKGSWNEIMLGIYSRKNTFMQIYTDTPPNCVIDLSCKLPVRAFWGGRSTGLFFSNKCELVAPAEVMIRMQVWSVVISFLFSICLGNSTWVMRVEDVWKPASLEKTQLEVKALDSSQEKYGIEFWPVPWFHTQQGCENSWFENPSLWNLSK